MKPGRRPVVIGTLCGVLVSSAAGPVHAQREFEPHFDKFSFRFDDSWEGLRTEARLDSETLGEGTTLGFEDDLQLDSSKTIPTLAFDWQIARKHRLWGCAGRTSTAARPPRF